jgi:hypothetical protein
MIIPLKILLEERLSQSNKRQPQRMPSIHYQPATS